MRVAFLGLGLIGGSVALALRRRAPETGMVAWSPTGDGPRRAAADGVIAAAAPTVAEALHGADLVVLAGPPIACLEVMPALAANRQAIPAAATITDVASTKRLLMEAAALAGLPFVGGHPMAGRETPGYAAADPDLFVGRPWVVVPGAAPRDGDVERVEWLARTVGAEPVRMSAGEHDDAVAAISHLPLVLSAALVAAVTANADGTRRVDWDVARRLGASGWRDMTRLARGDVAMGAGIAATNAAALATRIRDLRAVLDAWLADLDAVGASGGLDPQPLADRLRAARARLEEA